MASDFKITFSTRHDMSTESMSYLTTTLSNAVRIFLKDTGDDKICFTVSKNCVSDETRLQNVENGKESERVKKYVAVFPDERYTLERLILPEKTLEKILSPLAVFQNQDLLFNQWGLKKIAFPMVALSFEGLPGTGKTMAAHAVANFLGKKILEASYARIDSSYVAEGPKNVEAIFSAAMNQDAVLFIDDAEGLLSKRLSDVKSGSDNAVNSMRDQFLQTLEKFKGLVIFATNCAETYDPALETRLWTIHFDLPNKESRKRIWQQHLPVEFPINEDVTFEALSDIDDICGREIRSAVLEVGAAMIYRARGNVHDIIPATLKDFQEKVNEIKTRRKAGVQNKPKVMDLSDKAKKTLAEIGPQIAAEENRCENIENKGKKDGI